MDLAEVRFFDCARLTALERAGGDPPGRLRLRLRLVAASAAVSKVLGVFDMQQRFSA
ncbi:hypothetical protein AB0368_08745 [Actinoplanes sp. NPDC051475]|uniref:hypothetical protein n=1 Tax=Actinoplanes sp. NPDC051475 TaxID=3157225 RepID=UPI00345034A4